MVIIITVTLSVPALDMATHTLHMPFLPPCETALWVVY